MEIRKGDMVRSKANGIEGVIVAFIHSKSNPNSHFHKVELFCTYSPHNPRYAGTLILIDSMPLERKPNYEV